jgi:hypothetical protein
MVQAFTRRGGRFARQTLSADEARALRAALSGTTLAAPSPGAE